MESLGKIKPIRIVEIKHLELKFITPFVSQNEIVKLWQEHPNIIQQYGELYAVERYVDGSIKNLTIDTSYYTFAIPALSHERKDLIISNQIFAGGRLSLLSTQQDYINEWNRLFDYVKPTLTDINYPLKFFPYSLEYYNVKSNECIQMLPMESKPIIHN